MWLCGASSITPDLAPWYLGVALRSIPRYIGPHPTVSKRQSDDCSSFEQADKLSHVPRFKVPAGPDWVHEIKHDGYRLQVRRAGDGVRLFTRRGYDWSGRYPAIAATAVKLQARSFTLDGEACVCGPDGIAIFDALHRHGTVSEAMLYAFDLLELDGEDLRALPLGDRKKRLARLVGKRSAGIVLCDHTDDNGAIVFVAACRMGLEGIVSKRLTAPYRSGPSKDWLKVKNPNSPAMIRAREVEW
jgi:bifunctional non-homologous end joining protein LigD